ncbi:3-dehydroquinate synthase [Oscillatoria salina]|uniref:3-dehydroquinate synthase n=1 Tax=Oscillatoria salina TaxID=331517 RepID=UPI0013B6A9FC|nr:3-dehydroquinate synthase [Oscillatoria salina]MBZ8178886.1 3-dehydroquinate synthase [Oscillatoria salina IIICB1]NET86688.1 3-dehydroquinate synthase [Kamptonema sp. SIO1D9]
MTLAIAKKKQFQIQPIQQQVRVTFNYGVHFTNGLFELDNSLLAQVITDDGERGPKRAIAVIDSGVFANHPNLPEQIFAYAKRYKNILKLSTEPIIVPGGEASKNDPKLIEKLHSVINEVGLCRHSYLLAIGGGAVLDMAGYAAATAHRGVRLIRIPTTVLSQNDSAVGVKNGINAFGKKNFLGSFAPPYAVLNDFDFLKTLDERDWRSGIAEAVKVALIKDKNFFDFISSNATALAQRDMETMEQLIYRCAQLHLDHIANSGDPFEMGSSRPLDFGHWAAHRLEYLTNYELRHGEAVAIGIALDSTYSYLLGWLSLAEWQQIIKTLTEIGFDLFVPELVEQIERPEHPRSVFKGLSEFQEHLGGELTITLLSKLGRGKEVSEVDLDLYQQAISFLQQIEYKLAS